MWGGPPPFSPFLSTPPRLTRPAAAVALGARRPCLDLRPAATVAPRARRQRRGRSSPDLPGRAALASPGGGERRARPAGRLPRAPAVASPSRTAAASTGRLDSFIAAPDLPGRVALTSPGRGEHLARPAVWLSRAPAVASPSSSGTSCTRHRACAWMSCTRLSCSKGPPGHLPSARSPHPGHFSFSPRTGSAAAPGW